MNAAVAKIDEDDDDADPTALAPTKVVVTALERLAQRPPSETNESSEIVQAFRAWSEVASRPRRTESGIVRRVTLPPPSASPPSVPDVLAKLASAAEPDAAERTS